MVPFLETANFEFCQKELQDALEELGLQFVIPRMWDKDWTVWKEKDDEISRRLGWLDSPFRLEGEAGIYMALASSLGRAGVRRAVLLGMGGSSLAPEVFGRVFRPRLGFPSLHILDSTAPGAVRRALRIFDPRETLFIVSSKSGTTVETRALFNVFYASASDRLGRKRAGRRFLAITDPGTPLETLAGKFGFRGTYHGDPAIGGRFSVFSAFGLLPAAILGLDLVALLSRARQTALACREAVPGKNPAARLGALLAVSALKGKDKLTILTSPRLASLAFWLEQLIAESTGKAGRGILPVWEPEAPRGKACGQDRLFAVIRTKGDSALGAETRSLGRKGIPLIATTVEDPLDLAGQFYLWEMATAVAGHLLGINPFDQPDVESTKRRTREILASGGGEAESGAVPAAREFGGIRVFAETPEPTLEQTLRRFFSQGRYGGYFATQAFISPGPRAGVLLQLIRNRLEGKYGLPATWGYGPRYLHSTGQLHKGDGGKGLFLQVAEDEREDVPIPGFPDSPAPAPGMSALISAQAWGDYRALKDAGRRIVKLNLRPAAVKGLERLLGCL